MSKIIKTKIVAFLSKAGKRGINYKELKALCKVKGSERIQFKKAIAELENKGEIVDRGFKIYLTQNVEAYKAEILRINKTFGFAKRLSDDAQVFIPGKFFMGALPKDIVLIAPIKPRKNGTTQKSLEGEVIKIIKYGDSEFTGVLKNEMGQYFVEPDSLMKMPVPINGLGKTKAKIGDKVLAKITVRGQSHSNHQAMLLQSYGDAQTASACADSILDSSGVPVDFSAEVKMLAEEINSKGISPKDLIYREDLRMYNIFTIDGADSKDLDDAVSIEKYGDMYQLGVHIADVSHYIKPNSPIDKEAFDRGTSIYFANRVIPMLPKALSNGICSLNPNEDRLTFSAIMTINNKGKLVDYEFKKTVINSRVKGVYTEINQILDDSANSEIRKKYAGLTQEIFLMEELADILTQNKRNRGAPEIETNESKILINADNIAVDVVGRERGKSEVIIEEFMLMANQAAASAAKLKELPFVYRVHEPPSEEKLETLVKTLRLLGLDTSEIRLDMPPKVLANIIRQAEGLPTFRLVNTTVLRSMSKAKYSEVPLGHYGLALDDYAHFTSPIRRYPDLAIHRVLSEVVSNTPLEKLKKRYDKFVIHSSRKATETELIAMQLERACEDCYKAEYMKNHIGEEFEGIISSLAQHGVYVELDNTIEGLVRADDLPNGEYIFDDLLEYRNVTTEQTYRIGDKVKVKCVKTDVNVGNIDFLIVD